MAPREPTVYPALSTIMQQAAAAAGVATTAQATADTVTTEVFGAWTAYSPGLFATVGTITSLFGTPAGQYKLLGKACIFWCAGVININGTGAGELIMSIPKTLTDPSLRTQLIPVRIAPATSALVCGLGMPAGNNTQFRINKYDGTYPGGDGYGIYMSGTYQWTLQMPYKSKAQAAYFNIHKKELERKGVNVDEWNSKSKGKKLPSHKRKK